MSIAQRSADGYHELVVGAPVCIHEIDRGGRLISMNPAGLEMLELESEREVIGLPYLDAVAAEDRERVGALLCRAFEGEPSRFEFRSSSEPPRVYASSFIPIRGDAGSVVRLIGVTQDITAQRDAERELRALEVDLRQTQKMEALGTLAGGIAHDFNNILMAIFGYAELARGVIPSGSEAERNLDNILVAGKRAAHLVEQILTFIRKDDAVMTDVALHEIVDEAVALLRATLPATIELRAEIHGQPRVCGDAGQILQVLLNLGTNASHAMRAEGGVLEIVLGESQRCETSSFLLQACPEGCARITVRDSGHGMDPATVERVFDPFFTTKDLGEGTGLGLSVVHGIVRNHGGSVDVISRPGQGTTFEVCLPLATDRPCRESAARDEARGGSERILLIDDEPAVAELGRRILERYGYEVEVFTGALEGLERFVSDPERFDVVVTDQTMPGRTGFEIAESVRELRPDLPVILVTGYGAAADNDARPAGVRCVVAKPFKSSELASAIRRALDAPRFSRGGP